MKEIKGLLSECGICRPSQFLYPTGRPSSVQQLAAPKQYRILKKGDSNNTKNEKTEQLNVLTRKNISHSIQHSGPDPNKEDKSKGNHSNTKKGEKQDQLDISTTGYFTETKKPKLDIRPDDFITTKSTSNLTNEDFITTDLPSGLTIDEFMTKNSKNNSKTPEKEEGKVKKIVSNLVNSTNTTMHSSENNSNTNKAKPDEFSNKKVSKSVTKSGPWRLLAYMLNRKRAKCVNGKKDCVYISECSIDLRSMQSTCKVLV